MAKLGYAELRRLFDELEPPKTAQGMAYATHAIANAPIRLGKSKDGNPCLLIPGKNDDDLGPDRHYANLRLRHGVRLRLENSVSLSLYSVVECVSQNGAVQDWFLRLSPSLLERLGSEDAILDDQIGKIGELFRLLDKSARTSLPGLWSELALIVDSMDPQRALEAWHPAANASHDFTQDGFHVEVKAAESGRRAHHFSLRQLHPPEAVVIASMMLVESDAGTSVMDLYEEAIELVFTAPELQEKLNRHVIASVGSRLALAEDTRFDFPLAIASCRGFFADDVPQVSLPLAPGVSNVEFTADLEHTESVVQWTSQDPHVWRNLLARVPDTRHT